MEAISIFTVEAQWQISRMKYSLLALDGISLYCFWVVSNTMPVSVYATLLISACRAMDIFGTTTMFQ